MPESTMRTWTRGATITHDGGRPPSRFAPIVTAIPGARGAATIPFVGLAEAYALRAIRTTGVPLQRIRPALARLQKEFALEHVLASRRLYSDGVEVLYDFSIEADSDDIVVARSGQRVFVDVVKGYLQSITWEGGYAQAIPLPGYGSASVVVAYRKSFGQPFFRHGGARVQDALSLFKAGEPPEVVAEQFGMSVSDLVDALRVSLDRVA